ncbi:MAG: glycoside hydrolase family 43 protein [Actinomycetota bacterium]|nr:glycoside hydrolase family 43 protein [Actinomycetota bacterium]
MSAATYVNPVHDGYFADPFVMEIEGAFWAYGTGLHHGERVFEVMHSEDLVHWTSLGGALVPLPDDEGFEYWAPEVAEHEGTYYMYYSAGAGDDHRLRLATADRPDGPFHDAGIVLTGDDPFSIDAHPFRDDDGTWYLYYARDFLEGERIGTALVVDRLVDMTELAGDRHTVLRATAEWQLFRRRRRMYGGVHDWYTVEGPFLRKHDGRYYCFYSGGSWQEPTYGVSYAVADAPLGPFTDAGTGPEILTSIPGEVIGPGHNSIVAGPDGNDYIIYHAWDSTKSLRRMFVDRLDWTPEGPRCDGPSTTPRPVPQRTS